MTIKQATTISKTKHSQAKGKFRKAVNKNPKKNKTLNNAVTLETSNNALVDLFFTAPSYRGKDIAPLITMFEKALKNYETLPYQLLLWLRDRNNGAGERQIFRDILNVLEKTHQREIIKLIPHIPTFGRWDDLMVFKTKKAREVVFNLIFNTIWVGSYATSTLEGMKSIDKRGVELIIKKMNKKFSTELSTDMNADELREHLLRFQQVSQNLCKWMPRVYRYKKVNGEHIKTVANKNHYASNKFIKEFREHLKLTDAQYRKMISSNSKTVEQLMCSKKWDEITYSNLPSFAMKKYSGAFSRNDEARFSQFLADLSSGKETVNSATLFPYHIYKSNADLALVQAQWNALPNFITKGKRILPIVDVSGSMTVKIPNTSTRVIDVAESLGVYIATKQEGDFEGLMMTFSSTPMMIDLYQTGSKENIRDLLSRYRDNVGYSTDIEETFKALLSFMTVNEIKPEDAPEYIVMFTDMEFDEATDYETDSTTFENIDAMYKKADIKRPNLVFWNLNARVGNVPVKYDENGTALVSGFSPSLMESILSFENLTPIDIVMSTISKECYKVLDK